MDKERWTRLLNTVTGEIQYDEMRVHESPTAVSVGLSVPPVPPSTTGSAAVPPACCCWDSPLPSVSHLPCSLAGSSVALQISSAGGRCLRSAMTHVRLCEQPVRWSFPASATTRVFFDGLHQEVVVLSGSQCFTSDFGSASLFDRHITCGHFAPSRSPRFANGGSHKFREQIFSIPYVPVPFAVQHSRLSQYSRRQVLAAIRFPDAANDSDGSGARAIRHVSALIEISETFTLHSFFESPSQFYSLSPNSSAPFSSPPTAPLSASASAALAAHSQLPRRADLLPDVSRRPHRVVARASARLVLGDGGERRAARIRIGRGQRRRHHCAARATGAASARTQMGVKNAFVVFAICGLFCIHVLGRGLDNQWNALMRSISPQTRNNATYERKRGIALTRSYIRNGTHPRHRTSSPTSSSSPRTRSSSTRWSRRAHRKRRRSNR